jgi:CBS domain containing-hemolysin-like protein
MLADLFLTFLLVLLNGFFVAAEFALVKVRSSQIDLLAQKGSKRAKVAQQLVEKLDSYLSATQLGITLASLGLGALTLS